MAITKLVITGNTTSVGISSTPITISLANKAQATSVVPDDNITATNVQDALEQLDDIKAPIDSPDFTGTATMDGLTVNSGTQNLVATFQSTDTEAQIALVDTTGTSSIRARNDLRFHVNNLETPALKIDSSGSVGIGTTSPSSYVTDESSLYVQGQIRVDGISNTAALPALTIRDTNSGIFAPASNTIAISVGTYEAMRIDSSGNVLVGKTASNFNAEGIELKPDHLQVTRNSTVAYFNRTGSDGIISSFYKDGEPVGSIGTKGGELFIAHDGTIDSGLRFQGNGTIIPVHSTGSSADNAQDLGATLYRFKDLYLSGGVHLGGTGDANKLDDYEEGTWTPTFIGATTAGTTSLSVSSSTYVKVGALVTVQCYLQNIDGDNTTASGNLQITGLPFVSEKFTPITLSHVNCFDFDEQTTSVSGYTNQGNTSVSLARGSSTELLSAANLSGTGKYLMFHATYKTTA